MSEGYVPPPPPYERSLQHDQTVAEEVQALEISKGTPFRDEECKDSKHSWTLANEVSRVNAIHSLPNDPKRPTKSDSASLRAPRPLPTSPADTHPLVPRKQASKFRPVVVDTKAYAAQNDHERELHSPVPPPFSAIGPSVEEPSYLQSMLHPIPSVHPTPLHYPSQPSWDPPRRSRDNRRPVTAYSSIERCADTSFRRSSHMPSQSSSYSLPQNTTFGTRMSFDPSVAYSNSQANARTTLSAQRGAAASLYSSAVSSHLHLDSAMMPGSRQSYVPSRPALWNTETSRLDKTDADVRSVRSNPSVPMYPSPSTTPLYSSRSSTISEYEQRWATSESDIARDVYHN